MSFYEYNLRRRCQTRAELDVEEAQILRLLAAPDGGNKDALRTRLAIVRRVREELTQTTLAL